MWRQDDVIGSLDAASRHPFPPEPSADALAERLTRPGPVNLPAAPLMHGTGAFNAMWNLCLAGSVVTLTGRSFDVVELLDTVRARAGEVAVDRRRRVRQAHAPRARRRTGALGRRAACGSSSPRA